MPFTTPMAWEAVAYYDGKGGREHFADHAVGTGPFRLALYEKQHRFTLERNETWYGSQPAERATRPAPSSPTRSTRGTSPRAASMPPMPAGACPSSTASSSTASARTSRASTSFCRATTTTAASSRRASTPWSRATGSRPTMAGARHAPRQDGGAQHLLHRLQHGRPGASGTPAGERGRKLRQAMSLAVDSKQYPRAVPERPRRAGADAAAARHLRLRRRATRTPSASTTSTARASCWPRPATRTASTPRPARRLKLTFDTSATTAAASLPVRVLADAWRQTRARRRDQRHHLQSIPGQGAARRLPDLHLGLGRRLPGPGELPVPAGVPERALQERRAEHGELLQRRVRPALPAR